VTAADLALEAIALDEAALRDALDALTRSRDAYRDALSVALEQAHALNQTLDRERRERARLVDELRHLRGGAMRQAVAA
jgi:hypothetical protein